MSSFWEKLTAEGSEMDAYASGRVNFLVHAAPPTQYKAFMAASTPTENVSWCYINLFQNTFENN